MNSQGLWMSAKTSVSPNDHKFPEALGKVLLYLDWVPKPITGARRARTMEPTRWSTQRHVTRFFLPTAWLGKYGTLLGGRKKEEKKKGMHVGRPPCVLYLSWPSSPASLIEGVSFKGVFKKAKVSGSPMHFY